MTTTTRRFFTLPEIGGPGLSISKLNADVWGYSPWYPLAERPVLDFYVCNIDFQIAYVAGNDVTYEMLIELASGYDTGSQTILVQVPYSFRADTNVGYYLDANFKLSFPEPVFVRAFKPLLIRTALSANNQHLNMRVRAMCSTEDTSNKLFTTKSPRINNFQTFGGAGFVSSGGFR